MQRLQDRVVDECGETGAVRCRARLLRQRLQDAPRVVGAAEEGAIEPLRGRQPGALTDQRQETAEERSGEQPHRQLITGHIRDAADEPHETERHGESDQQRQRHHAAAHQDVPGAAAQQCGNLHRPVLDDRIAERHGNREERQDGQRPCQRRNACG